MEPAIPTAPKFRCRICKSWKRAESLLMYEMMFGFRSPFTYTFCASCGTLSQEDFQEFEIAKYYPPNYYSYENQHSFAWKTKYALLGARYIPEFIIQLSHRVRRSYSMQTLADLRLELKLWLGEKYSNSARILDVGCGSGNNLKFMHYAGFRAEGLDPFYQGNNPEGVKIHRCQLPELEARQYDLITFQHSLEHLPEPAKSLEAAQKLLTPGGVCVVKLPKFPNRAFLEYGVNWYAIDAPRHFFIPSVEGLTTLAKSVGFAEILVRDAFDRKEFVWSEGYKRDIPMVEIDLDKNFEKSELNRLYEKALDAFSNGLSGTADFIMRKG